VASRLVRRRRVVVTGLGCVTPLGGDVDSTWEAAVEGRSGIGPFTRFDTCGFQVRFGGEVRGELDLGDVAPKEVRRLDRMIALAVAASREAVRNGGLMADAIDRERIGVAIGSGIGGITTLEKSFEIMRSR